MAGLIEGDGSFNVPKIIKDSNKRVARIEVAGNSKDLPAFEFLKSKFGGNIYCSKSGKSLRWMIKDLNSVNVVNTINGKLITPKIIRFHCRFFKKTAA